MCKKNVHSGNESDLQRNLVKNGCEKSVEQSETSFRHWAVCELRKPGHGKLSRRYKNGRECGLALPSGKCLYFISFFFCVCCASLNPSSITPSFRFFSSPVLFFSFSLFFTLALFIHAQRTLYNRQLLS